MYVPIRDTDNNKKKKQKHDRGFSTISRSIKKKKKFLGDILQVNMHPTALATIKELQVKLFPNSYIVEIHIYDLFLLAKKYFSV